MYEHDGCEWDEHMHYCYSSTDPSDISCERFAMSYECNKKPGCQFDQDAERCFSKSLSLIDFSNLR